MLEADTIKQVEMKEGIKKEYLKRTRKLPQTKLFNRNLIKRDKYQGCIPRNLGPFLKWTKEDLE